MKMDSIRKVIVDPPAWFALTGIFGATMGAGTLGLACHLLGVDLYEIPFSWYLPAVIGFLLMIFVALAYAWSVLLAVLIIRFARNTP